MEAFISNRDDFLFHSIKDQAEKKFDNILLMECKRRQRQARQTHFLEGKLPGYAPFMLQQSGVFTTRAGEVTYTYRCQRRTCLPVNTERCYNKLQVHVKDERKEAKTKNISSAR